MRLSWLVLLFLWAPPAVAGSWQSDQSAGSLADTELRNNWGNPLGTITNNEVRHQQPGLTESPRRFIIRSTDDFTVIVPSGSTVDSAFVNLKIASFFEMSTDKLSAHAVPEAWSELEATWVLRATGTNWTNEGAWGAPGDGGPNLDTYSGPYAAGTWVRFNIAAYVQSVVDGGAQNGVLVKRDIEITTGAGVVRWNTREAGTQADRPWFSIFWTEGGGKGAPVQGRVPPFLPR